MHNSTITRFRHLPPQTGWHLRIFCGRITRKQCCSISGARPLTLSRSPGFPHLWAFLTSQGSRGDTSCTFACSEPVATLISSVDLAGTATPVSTEYFAASADVHLVLGHITADEYTCDYRTTRRKRLSHLSAGWPGWSAQILRRSAITVPCRSQGSSGTGSGRSFATPCAAWQKNAGPHRLLWRASVRRSLHANATGSIWAGTWSGGRCTARSCGPGNILTDTGTISHRRVQDSPGSATALPVLTVSFFFLFPCILFFMFTVRNRLVTCCPARRWVITGGNDLCPADGTDLSGPGCKG